MRLCMKLGGQRDLVWAPYYGSMEHRVHELANYQIRRIELVIGFVMYVGYK